MTNDETAENPILIAADRIETHDTNDPELGPNPAFLEAVRTLGGVPASDGKPVFEFRFTHFRPSPFWPTDLNAFPVLDYERELAPPDGSPAAPFVIAVNEGHDIDTQVLAATDYVISILRRQAGVLEVQAGEREIESLVDSASEMDVLSRSESIALARAMRAGQSNEVRLSLSRWGFGVHATFSSTWLDRPGFVGRSRFFAQCYNSLPPIRRAIDRIVSATIGNGPRVSGSSEDLRVLIEQGSQDARMSAYAAHAVRDALLIGAGALEISMDYGFPRPRLIRPDRLVLQKAGDGENRTFVVGEADDQGNVRKVNALVLPGQEQPGSSYPCSILEPWSYSLHTILQFRADAENAEATLPPETERSPAARSLATSVVLLRRLADQSEEQIESYLGRLTQDFDIPAQPLYLRGRELWS